MYSWVEHEQSFMTLGPGHTRWLLGYQEADQILFYNLLTLTHIYLMWSDCPTDTYTTVQVYLLLVGGGQNEAKLGQILGTNTTPRGKHKLFHDRKIMNNTLFPVWGLPFDSLYNNYIFVNVIGCTQFFTIVIYIWGILMIMQPQKMNGLWNMCITLHIPAFVTAHRIQDLFWQNYPFNDFKYTLWLSRTKRWRIILKYTCSEMIYWDF